MADPAEVSRMFSNFPTRKYRANRLQSFAAVCVLKDLSCVQYLPPLSTHRTRDLPLLVAWVMGRPAHA